MQSPFGVRQLLLDQSVADTPIELLVEEGNAKYTVEYHEVGKCLAIQQFATDRAHLSELGLFSFAVATYTATADP